MRTLGEQDVWQCPRCGRGSPDIRDEAAHVDAHRRLERDRSLVTWEVLAHRLTRPEPESTVRKRRPTALVLSLLAAMLLASLLLSVRPGEVLPRQADETATPGPTVPSAPGPPTTVAGSDAAPAVAGQPAPTVPPGKVETGAPPAAPPGTYEPVTPELAPPTTLPAEPVDPPHILEVCIPTLCLAV